ncbi:MAG: LytTR family DNA-binding domain-containing protein [Rhodospirillaceae bacterium]
MNKIPSFFSNCGASLSHCSTHLALGFVYWLIFLLALEPGNVLRAIAMQRDLLVDLEIVRILGASVLGASATPVVFLMVRFFPVAGSLKLRNAILQTFGLVAMAVLLIAASVVLAARLLPPSEYPLSTDLLFQLKSNILILTFCLIGLSAIAHAKFFSDQSMGPADTLPDPFLSHVMVKTRGGLIRLDLADVIWIESQGNYLALHAGEAVHLIREPITAFCAKLDPSHFIRVHRGVVVAIDAIRDMSSLSGGDASLTLQNETRLRVSRTYSAAVRAALMARTD